MKIASGCDLFPYFGHSVFLPEKIPWTEEPEWLLSIVLQRVGHAERLNVQAPLNQKADF